MIGELVSNVKRRFQRTARRIRHGSLKRLVRGLAKISLKYATLKAQRTLSLENPLKVLVDNTVMDVAIAHETKWITTNIQKIGDYEHHAGHLARVPVYGFQNKTNRHVQASYLTGLVHLAKLGFIKFYTSAELKDEQFRQPMGRFRGYGLFDRSIFADLDIATIDGHVFPHLGSHWLKLQSVEEQQRKRIRDKSDPTFQMLHDVLSKQLGPKCSQDCWHIRTAEAHDCFAFLTTDGPLLKAWKSLSRKKPLSDLRIKVLSPSELGALLQIQPVSPVLLSYEGGDAIVRVDTTMPGEARRPASRYRKP